MRSRVALQTELLLLSQLATGIPMRVTIHHQASQLQSQSAQLRLAITTATSLIAVRVLTFLRRAYK